MEKAAYLMINMKQKRVMINMKQKNHESHAPFS